jgi:hypothetical protein
MEDAHGDVAKAKVFRAAFARSQTDIWFKGTECTLAHVAGLA